MKFLNKEAGVIALVAIVIAIGGYFYPSVGQSVKGNLGGVTNYDNITLTSSNTATSTLVTGCIQTYATSTATAVRFVLSSAASSTPTYGIPAVGGVSWQYGTCPV